MSQMVQRHTAQHCQRPSGRGIVKRPVRGLARTATDGASRGDVRIMVDIRMTNGQHIQKRGMGYADLKRLIAKLEALY